MNEKIKLGIEVFGAIMLLLSFIFNIIQYNRNSKINKENSDFKKYEIMYKDQILILEQNIDNLGNFISDIEILNDATKYTTIQELEEISEKLDTNKLASLSDDRSKIYNNVWRLISSENSKSHILNENINQHLLSIQNRIVTITNYKKNNTNPFTNTLPKTGGLPELEKIFNDYKNEEDMRIKQLKEKLISF